MKLAVKKMYRTDFFAFCQKAIEVVDIKKHDYLALIAQYLQKLPSSETKRLLINAPPRHLKTKMCSAFAAFYLGNNPKKEIIAVSCDEKLAHGIVDDIREILRKRWFCKVFPNAMIKTDHSRTGDFKTISGGGVVATTINGRHAGMGADLLIIDDALDVKQWNDEEEIETVVSRVRTLQSRFNNRKKGLALFVAHRLNENDPSARLLASGNWDHLCLPLCAVKREVFDLGHKLYVREIGSLLRGDSYEESDLEEIRKPDPKEPPYKFYYQQGFGDRQYAEIKRQHIRTYKTYDFSGMHHVISIDPAQKGGEENAHNAVLVWATDGEYHWLRERFYKRCDYQVLKQMTLALAQRYNASMILIEDTANGSALINEISGKHRYKVEAIVPRKSKSQRLYEVADVIAARKLLVPEWADWKEEFRSAFVSPSRKGSDQVDATTQYLSYMKGNPDLERRVRQTDIAAALGSDRSSFPVTEGPARVGVASRDPRMASRPGPQSRFPELRDQAPNSGYSDLVSYGSITARRYR